MKEKNEQIT